MNNETQLAILNWMIEALLAMKWKVQDGLHRTREAWEVQNMMDRLTHDLRFMMKLQETLSDLQQEMVTGFCPMTKSFGDDFNKITDQLIETIMKNTDRDEDHLLGLHLVTNPLPHPKNWAGAMFQRYTTLARVQQEIEKHPEDARFLMKSAMAWALNFAHHQIEETLSGSPETAA